VNSLFDVCVFVNRLSDYGYTSAAFVQCRIICSPVLSMIDGYFTYFHFPRSDDDRILGFLYHIIIRKDRKAYIRLITILKEDNLSVIRNTDMVY
jgi:hypothetical protein